MAFPRKPWLNQAECYILYWHLEFGAKRLCGEAGILARVYLHAWQVTLGEQPDPFLSAYKVTERGNFEGRNILELICHIIKNNPAAGSKFRA